jgi:hypothetical protein
MKFFKGKIPMPEKIMAIKTTNNTKTIIPATKRKKALNKTPIACPNPLLAFLTAGPASDAKAFPLSFTSFAPFFCPIFNSVCHFI